MYIEIWKNLNCFNIKDIYQISSFGNVKNKNTGRLLSQPLSNGYRTIVLQMQDGSRKTLYVHILVATMFIFNDDPLNKIQVNHKNLCRCDCSVWNLEWVTPIENIHHELANRDNKKDFSSIEEKFINNKFWGSGELTYGENNGMAVWTEEIVHHLCKLIEQGYSYSQALLACGLEDTINNRYNVSHIVQGRRWKHVSCNYNLSSRSIIDYSSYVIHVCELISQNKSTKEIIELLQLPGTYQQASGFVCRVRRKAAYKNISDLYF